MTEYLENKASLIEWIAAGEKPKDQWRIGTEHEKFGYRSSDFSPLPYDGPDGIKAMLEGLIGNGWQGKYEGETLVALTRPQEQGGGSVTLEPGGQLELSGAPLANIHQTCAEVGTHLKEVLQLAESLGQAYMGIGYAPDWSVADMPKMPKGRYDIMTNYMPTRGTRGLEMMYLTATVQVNLDFASEADMVEKMQIAIALQPIATALFANSPFINGQSMGHVSERSLVWLDTDAERTGNLPFVFDDFGYERYVDYALDVPMYFVIRGGRFIDATGLSFKDFLDGDLSALPGEKPTGEDWENHLTTLFPEARLKRFIEMRGADSGPRDTFCALPAFWVGLLYDEATQKKALDMISDWSSEERNALRINAARQGLKAEFRDGHVLDIARQALDLSREGLVARGAIDYEGANETQYLRPLEAVIEQGCSPAEALATKLSTGWEGDITSVYKALTY